MIGDIHFDPTYNTTGDSCNREMSLEERKVYGHYECDAPLALTKSSIHKANLHANKADFVMWAG